MRGFGWFLGKEFLEIVRTWRAWVLPGLMLFLAFSSPVLAKLTPQLLESAIQGQPGVEIVIPPPTYLDAYAQWIKNLQQVVVFVLLLTGGGMIAGERSSGTAVLVLTKPVSRAAFVIAKFVSGAALLIATTVAGTTLCWIGTLAVFGEAPPERLLSATTAWLGLALMLLAAMVLFSATLKSLAAGGVGVAAFFGLSVLTLWGPAVRYSPAGLLPAMTDLLAGEQVAIVWPSVTTALVTLALLACAEAVFRRAEI